jgi:hypothetical protein
MFREEDYKPYYYYAKSDSTKEPIDKVIALNYESAMLHFAERKRIEPNKFTELYEVKSE